MFLRGAVADESKEMGREDEDENDKKKEVYSVVEGHRKKEKGGLHSVCKE